MKTINVRRLSFILALAMLITSIPFVIFAEDATPAAQSNEIKIDEFPLLTKDETVYTNGYGGSVKVMNAEEAAAAGITDFEGNVVSVSGSTTGMGIYLDLDSVLNGIKIADVESLTFRVYNASNVKQFRVMTKYTSGASWQYQINPTVSEGWCDVELTDLSNKFVVSENEEFLPFHFAVRFTSNISTIIYLDSITVKLKEGVAGTVDPELGKVEIPFTAEDALSIYGYSEMRMYDAAGAAIAGVPEGFEGDYVMKLTNTAADLSFMLDLRQSVCKDVKIEDVESLTFRVWIPYAMDLRIRSVANEWLYNVKHTPAEGGGWRSFTIQAGSTQMSQFVDDGEGGFSPFALTFRNNYVKEAPCTVYIDGVTVVLKEIVEEPTETETETEAPVEPETPVVPDPLYYDFADGNGKEEIPYGEKSTDGSWYGYTNFKMMDEAQAKYAGVPEGYSGWVLALDPVSGGNTSIGLDLTGYRAALIEKITFRVWCPAGTKTADGVRLSGGATNTWSMLAEASAIGEWIEVVLEKDDFSFMDFDGDGFCDPTNFCFRGATETGYIDAITVELKPNDFTAPEITYNGETVINTSVGKPFVIDVSAYDEYEERDIAPEFIWSEGALDENGLLKAGNHTCTIKATDGYGNVSEIVLTVNVGALDTEAPKLSWCPDISAVYAMEGAIPAFNVTATDNYDKVDVVLTWSEGALNEIGRLNRGIHTLTISATDLTGNTTEYSVYVCVVSNRPTVGNVVSDSE